MAEVKEKDLSAGSSLNSVMTTTERERITEKLFDEVRANDDLILVERILQRYPDLIDAKIETDWGVVTSTLLLQACESGTRGLPTVQLLLKKGADVRATGSVDGYVHHLMFVHIKSRGGYGALDDVFPLYIASRRGALSVVEELLQYGAPISQTNAVGQSALHVASWIFDGYDSSIELREAANQNAVQIMKLLIENGASVNLQDLNGKTPLHYACYNGRGHLAQILLESGADISIKDKDGLTALDYACHENYNLTETIVKQTNLPILEVIEAYETAASLRNCPFILLSKATQMRLENNLPKTIQEPLECYGSLKEWETLEELKQYSRYESLQALLAERRIYKGRYLPFLRFRDDFGVDQGHFNALLRHHLCLFKDNNNYFYFSTELTMSCVTLRHLLSNTMERCTIDELVSVAFECCTQIQEALNTETKPRCIMEMVHELEQALFTVGAVILHLLRRYYDSNAPDEHDESDKCLAQNIFEKLWQKFPGVVSPVSGYRMPLQHVLYCSKYGWDMFIESSAHYRYKLVELFVDVGADINLIDSDGNTMLHVVISTWLSDNRKSHVNLVDDSLRVNSFENTVSHLLENGAYLYARNEMGKTVLEMLDDLKNEHLSETIAELIRKHDRFPTLQRLAALKILKSEICYRKKLPGPLVKYVALH